MPPKPANALLHGTLDALVLKTLARGARHGYAIARYIEETTGDAVLVEEVHRLLPGLPVLMMTGYSERPKDVTGTTCIQKPFEANELAMQLASLISGDSISAT